MPVAPEWFEKCVCVGGGGGGGGREWEPGIMGEGPTQRPGSGKLAENKGGGGHTSLPDRLHIDRRLSI